MAVSLAQATAMLTVKEAELADAEESEQLAKDTRVLAMGGGRCSPSELCAPLPSIAT